MKKFALSVLALMLILTPACKKEAKVEQLDRVVWSDDGTQQAYVMLRFEEKRSSNPLDGTTLKSNFSHQIYIQDLDGTNRRAVGNDIIGQNGFEFYYMKSQGYFIATFIQKLNADEPPFLRYYQLLMDGTTRTLTTGPNMTVIPSPDGKWLARVQTYPEGCRPDGAANASSSCQAEVEFLDAQTLVRHGKQEKVSFAQPSNVPDLTWNTRNELIVTNQKEAFALVPEKEPVTASVPGCLAPKTSSNNIHANGTLVYPNGSTISTMPASADAPRFGCQG